MDGDSLATDLLVEERIKGDALSADRVEYNSVTKALLDQGLALPKRRSVIVANTPVSLHVLCRSWLPGNRQFWLNLSPL